MNLDASLAASSSSSSSTGAVKFGPVNILTGMGGSSGAGSIVTWLALGLAAGVAVWFFFFRKKGGR